MFLPLTGWPSNSSEAIEVCAAAKRPRAASKAHVVASPMSLRSRVVEAGHGKQAADSGSDRTNMKALYDSVPRHVFSARLRTGKTERIVVGFRRCEPSRSLYSCRSWRRLKPRFQFPRPIRPV